MAAAVPMIAGLDDSTKTYLAYELAPHWRVVADSLSSVVDRKAPKFFSQKVAEATRGRWPTKGDCAEQLLRAAIAASVSMSSLAWALINCQLEFLITVNAGFTAASVPAGFELGLDGRTAVAFPRPAAHHTFITQLSIAGFNAVTAAFKHVSVVEVARLFNLGPCYTARLVDGQEPNWQTQGEVLMQLLKEKNFTMEQLAWALGVLDAASAVIPLNGFYNIKAATMPAGAAVPAAAAAASAVAVSSASMMEADARAPPPPVPGVTRTGSGRIVMLGAVPYDPDQLHPVLLEGLRTCPPRLVEAFAGHGYLDVANRALLSMHANGLFIDVVKIDSDHIIMESGKQYRVVGDLANENWIFRKLPNAGRTQTQKLWPSQKKLDATLQRLLTGTE
jgi:hypothetical protein